jgi:tetratricopeptide (TPR) repeat protein
MKALEKDRGRRYETANGFAMDVQRYLAGEPVLAAPASNWYRLRKLVRRNRGSVMAASLVFLTLVLGIVVSAWQAVRATQAEAAVRAEAEAKDKALAAESAQRERAEAGFLMARDTVDRFFTRVADSPQLKVQALERFRKELLQNAKEFYERSIREQNDAPEAQHDLGVAHHRLANIQQVLGDYTGAENSSQKAIAILSGLTRSHADSAEYQGDLAASYCGLGAVYFDTHRLDKSEAAYNQALVVQERLVRDHPEVAEYQRGLAATQGGLGLSYHHRYRLEKAQASFEAALAIWSRLAAKTPQLPADRHGLAATQQMLGDAYRSSAQTEKAEAMLKQAASTYQALVHDFPDAPESLDALGRTYFSLGLLYHDNMEQPKKADAAHRQALQIFEKLAQEHPHVLEYGYRLGLCYHALDLDAHQGGWEPREWMDGKAIKVLEHVVNKGYGAGRDVLVNVRISRVGSLPYAQRSDELEAIARLEGVSGTNCYNIACLFSLTSAAAENDSKLSRQDRARLKEQYSDRAIDFLRQAVAKGFRNTAILKSDKELNPLRSREEFKKLVHEAEQKK